MHSYVRHFYLSIKESLKHQSTDSSNHGSQWEKEKLLNENSETVYSHIKQVRLVWIVRTMEESILFDKTLQLLESDNLGGIFSYAVYITQGTSNRAAGASWRHGSFIGRPDIRAEISGK